MSFFAADGFESRRVQVPDRTAVTVIVNTWRVEALERLPALLGLNMFNMSMLR